MEGWLASGHSEYQAQLVVCEECWCMANCMQHWERLAASMAHVAAYGHCSRLTSPHEYVAMQSQRWDRSAASPALKDLLGSGKLSSLTGKRVLVPGCG